jgi:hypothetical protein
MLVCLFAALLVIGAVIGIQPSCSNTAIQKDTVGTTQGSGIIWNATDFNTTIAQQLPNINTTISPRAIIEYGDALTNQPITPLTQSFQISPRIVEEYADAALQLGINAPVGLNTTGTSPRIMIEYADYATYCYAFAQSYPGITLGISISSPVGNPQPPIMVNVNETISFNVTSSSGPLKNITLSFRTNLNQTWQSYTLSYNLTSPTNSTTAHIVIPGQSQPCNVTYEIEAYSYPYKIDNVTNSQGDYVMNDNAGHYYVYPVYSEFPSSLILPLLMVATLLGAIAYKKRRHPTDS